MSELYEHLNQANQMSTEQIKIEIEGLELSEKLLLVEDLWDSIAVSNSELTLSEWQKRN